MLMLFYCMSLLQIVMYDASKLNILRLLPFSSLDSQLDSQLKGYLSIKCGSYFITTNDDSINRLKNHRDFVTWYYTGYIRNPLTGNEIAGIEGLELVKSTPIYQIDEMNSSSNSTNQRNRIEKYGYLSKKIFIYTNPNNHSEILNEFRLNPLAPKRIIRHPFKEFYEWIHMSPKTTSSSLEWSKSNSNDNSSREKQHVMGNYEVLIHWPSDRKSYTNKMKISYDDQLESKKRYDITHFMSGGTKIKQETDTDNKSKRKSWKRNIFKWISFRDASSDLHGRSQEYYSFFEYPTFKLLHPIYTIQRLIHFVTNRYQNHSLKDIATAGMYYRRYGESPAWYALRHSSTIELTGYRLPSWIQIPSHVISMIDSISPNFIDDGLSLDNFHRHHDLASSYKSWYHYFRSPTTKQN